MEASIPCHVCAVCQKKSCYVCPRCSINYCSLACYRAPKHEKCSESFYRDCCMNAMHDRYVDPENKSRMLEILRREASTRAVESSDQLVDGATFSVDDVECENPESNADDFQSRFSDLNLQSNNIDTDVIWARLTLKERREFHRLVASGGIANYLPPWEPWWLSSKPNIEEVPGTNEENSPKTTKSNQNKPIPLKKIFPSGKQPHESLTFVLTEVILTHVFLCRWYNGDCQDLVWEYLLRLCQLAPSLCFLPDRTMPRRDRPTQENTLNRTVILSKLPTRPAVEYKSLAQVLASLQLRLSDLRMPCSPQVLIVLLGDLHALLVKENHLPRLFSELLDLVRFARKNVRLEENEEAEISRDQLQTVYKKLQFLHACVNPLDPDARKWQSTVLPTIQSQTTVELCRHVSDFNPNRTMAENARAPAAGPNWRNIIRSFPRTEEPLVTVLDAEAKPA
ncbi:Zinc finger HIT domain-containing protein 2 [Fasciola hepatica]|uniref:Zinc finger HIT domain-containing protein 2 n=1 Tax=Fasciola hepatica TaxID=6192 RepID=A0A4E0R5A2_FASHE|nr:Zinc finger HIT domain-containing protein 2 [Fasciola hepatica]